MSPVLPIDTQRYESGDYTLEITAHPSPLSQWSDRTVIRQLRFSLWSEQPQRQRLAAGDQHQLITLSDTVETYVQTHLTQQAWPPRHHLTLLDQAIELSTLQLFDLAEVLNACGQRQIILPARPASRSARRPARRRWWTGSAAASLLVAVGVTGAYLHYRPAAFNDVAITQAPEATFEDEIAASPEANSPETAAPALESAPADEQEKLENSEITPSGDTAFKTNQELAQQPLDQRAIERANTAPSDAPADAQTASRSDAQSAAAETDADVVAPAAGSAPAPEDTENTLPENTLPENTFETAMPEVAAAPPVVPRQQPSPTAAAEPPAAPAREEDFAVSDAPTEAITEATTGEVDDLLGAIATQLAPYQPTNTPYPLTYHLNIAPDGTILSADPISDNAPALEIPADTKVSQPGRPLQIDVIYTGNAQPEVRER